MLVMILIDNIIGKCDNSIIREVVEKERNKFKTLPSSPSPLNGTYSILEQDKSEKTLL